RDRVLPARRIAQGDRRVAGAPALGHAHGSDGVLPHFHSAGGEEPDPMRRRPYVLAIVTWLYIAWSLVPLLIAIQFSFNDGRSRSSWQGFSTRWYWGSSG